ncbi:MAG TPA: GTP 3',8-cyclase MoaA [Rhodanobacteraceae bacterium]|jgi:cyclic pyranopterin phosphate synthase|nr:GTP 3',8-cyclase MoaA [Rhodanobacteraceae bacterium]
MKPEAPVALQRAPAPPDALGRALADLRISVIDRCNFRCPYCMPEEAYPADHAFLRARDRLDFNEIERIARAFVSLGVRKLRLTGGEPLLRRDLPELVARLAAIDGVEDLALTTNGMLLPRIAQALRDAGLKRLTISMDSADPDIFRKLSGGRGELADVEAAIAAAETAGFGPLKINCVVMRGVNDAGVLDLVERFRGSGHVVRFIEYMDVGTVNGWRNDRVVPGRELVERIGARWPLEALPRRASSTSRRWRLRDGSGEVGFINSVTEPFCGGCTRARLSADGKLYTCLFAHAGHDLRALLRAGESDEALRGTVAGIWSHRGDRYSERRAELRAAGVLEHVEMYRIGG